MACAGALGTALGCTSSEARREREQQAVRGEMARAETTATRAAALPATGLWTPEHVVDRLLRAGVAPRLSDETPPQAAWMGRTPQVVLAGGGTVYAWIYADSVARKAVTDALDPATGAPVGAVTPFPAPLRFLVQGNLAVVITGGRETNQERIALAFQAGLPTSGSLP